MQNPAESLGKQIRRARERLPEGFCITRYYWDVESGGTDLDARSRHGEWQHYADAGIPRDGGMADLRAAVASGNPPFSAVICENIERSGRDMFDALKLEKELRAAGLVVFATDEPIDIQAAEGSTILVRRVKQGVAEYFRYQIKAQMWEGLRQYVIGGWNTGKTPYGYAAERSTHPNPIKASMGATRARLIPDPERGPWVTRIYEWRVAEKVSYLTIARRLDAAAAPSPDGNGWTAHAVARILRNPKYTGRVVLGRTRNGGTSHRKGERKVRPVPRAYWTWADEANAHPALVPMELWEQAQAIGAERGNVRDPENPTPASAARTLYPLRGRIRHAACKRRMHGTTRTGRDGTQRYVYYVCPHDPGNPRHAAACPGHHSARIGDQAITAAIAAFMDDHLLGHDRAAMLTAQLPASTAEQHQQRQRRAAALRRKLALIQTAQKGLLAQSARLGEDTSPAANAMRDRITQDFTERHNQHTALQAELDALTAAPAPALPDPALLDELPYAPGLLAQAPAAIQQALYAAFDIQCLYRHDSRQVTIWATITDTTPGIIRALLTDPRTSTSTSTSTGTAASTDTASLFADLRTAAITATMDHRCPQVRARAGAGEACVMWFGFWGWFRHPAGPGGVGQAGSIARLLVGAVLVPLGVLVALAVLVLLAAVLVLLAAVLVLLAATVLIGLAALAVLVLLVLRGAAVLALLETAVLVGLLVTLAVLILLAVQVLLAGVLAPLIALAVLILPAVQVLLAGVLAPLIALAVLVLALVLLAVLVLALVLLAVLVLALVLLAA